MKVTLMTLLLSLSSVMMLGGCEKTDYQHPMHRNGSK